MEIPFKSEACKTASTTNNNGSNFDVKDDYNVAYGSNNDAGSEENANRV